MANTAKLINSPIAAVCEHGSMHVLQQADRPLREVRKANLLQLR